MTRLSEGDAAPAFQTPRDQDGIWVTLASLRKESGPGGAVVVYFYPADGHTRMYEGSVPVQREPRRLREVPEPWS